jgi:hypothetical protein
MVCACPLTLAYYNTNTFLQKRKKVNLNYNIANYNTFNEGVLSKEWYMVYGHHRQAQADVILIS